MIILKWYFLGVALTFIVLRILLLILFPIILKKLPEQQRKKLEINIPQKSLPYIVLSLGSWLMFLVVILGFIIGFGKAYFTFKKK